MEISCFELVCNNKDLLAMGEWHNAQAACVYAQVEFERYWERDFSGYLRLKHPLAQKYFETIKTWSYGFSKLLSAPPLWYINKAIEERLLNIPEALLREVKEYVDTRLPEDCNKLLERYKYLAQKLDLALQEKDEILIRASGQGVLKKDGVQIMLTKGHGPDSKEENKYPWVPGAREIFKALRLDESQLNLERKAKKVQAEMQKRFEEGDTRMGKRGGKAAPAWESIRRHALKGL